MYEEYLEKNKYIDYDNESVYKLALDLKDKSSDKIVEHVILDGATSTGTVNGQTMSYAGVYSDFNEAFSKFFTDDLSDGT